MKKLRVTTRVSCTVEVDLEGWTDAHRIDETFAQASKEGKGVIESLIATRGRVIGTPRVLAVMTEVEA